MKKVKPVLVAAGLSLTMALTVSCSSDDGEYSSDNVIREWRKWFSSIDFTPGSQFNPDITYGSLTDSRDNKTYRTVVIGEQTWMAENLNYNADGSKCYGDGGPVYAGFDEKKNEMIYTTLSAAEAQAICAKYGRLYNWATAMALDPIYNESSAGDVGEKPRGICPDGWHIPSYEEWKQLVIFAEEDTRTCEDESYAFRCPTAGKHLRAKGWMSSDEDTHGFSALPSGRGCWNASDLYIPWEKGYYPANCFNGFGDAGVWWNTSHSSYGAGVQLLVGLDYPSTTFNYNDSVEKTYFHSVRCLQD